MLDMVQQVAMMLELAGSFGTFLAVGIGCQGAALAGAAIDFDDAATGEPLGTIVVSLACVLAFFPGHLLCATEFVIPV